MRFGLHGAGIAFVAMAVGCAEPAIENVDALPRLRSWLEPFGVEPVAAESAVAPLAWKPFDDACPWVYRIETEYEPDLKFEADSTSVLAIGSLPRNDRRSVPPGISTATVFYRGVRAEQRGVTRDVYASRTFLGPAAPTAACMPKTWDPIEDAFALGWPRLTDRLTATGEHWSGLRVEGKCNRSACIDPLTGAGGPDNHHRACVTMSWRETLAGIYTLGGEPYALVESRWSDGHTDPSTARGLAEGIWTERRALVSLRHGRPVWAQAIVHHGLPSELGADGRFTTVERTWTMAAIDACPGSLATVGWERPDDVVQAAAEAVDALARAPELRRNRNRAAETDEASSDGNELGTEER